MELVRDKLRPLLAHLTSAHAGLLLQRGLTDWEDSEKALFQLAEAVEQRRNKSQK